MTFGKNLLIILFSLSILAGTAQAIYGQATWYDTGTGGLPGACGRWNANTELVVALPPIEYAAGTRCFRKVRIHYQGKTMDAQIVDLCPTCGLTGIDLSPSAFQTLAPLDLGVLQVTWEYI